MKKLLIGAIAAACLAGCSSSFIPASTAPVDTPVDTPSTAGPELQISCTLGYGSGDIFIAEDSAEWWITGNWDYNIPAVGPGSAGEDGAIVYKILQGTVAQVENAMESYWDGPYSTESEAQQEESELSAGTATQPAQPFFWQTYTTEIQAQATNNNSASVPVAGVNYAIFDSYGDELGTGQVYLNVVSIAPDVTLTSSSPETLGANGNLWNPGTTCKTTTYTQ